MQPIAVGSPADWTAQSLAADTRWIFTLDAEAQRDLAAAVLRGQEPGKQLIDYRRGDFDLGAATGVLAAAFHETQHGRGIALVRGLPRDALDETQFELLTWAIGLHFGVPRPQ